MIKTILIYKDANVWALKGKDKHLLPAFCLYNKKAWTMRTLFLNWFHWCIVPEVKSTLLVRDCLIFLIVFQIQLSPFLPHPSPPPTLEPTAFSFVHVSFIHVPWWPFSYFPLLSLSLPPLWLLSVCSLFQSLWLYFACLFIMLVSFH